MTPSALVGSKHQRAHLYVCSAKKGWSSRPRFKPKLSRVSTQPNCLSLSSSPRLLRRSSLIIRSSIFDEAIAARPPVDPDPSLVNEGGAEHPALAAVDCQGMVQSAMHVIHALSVVSAMPSVLECMQLRLLHRIQLPMHKWIP